MTVATPVYLDNHATTRVDPRVVEAMLPYFTDDYGNAGSTNHVFGWRAHDAVESARRTIAESIGASPKELVFTSGATESNNLAIRGVAERAARGRHVVSVTTEHKAVLDPLRRLARKGFEITWVAPRKMPDHAAGVVDPAAVAEAIRDDTVLVSVMLANNEIGAVAPLADIGALCRQRGVLLHTDATQAVGKLPVDVGELQVDLLSCSAHKLYGPKGVGALYVRRGVRLAAQIDGGGQERGLRSGTLNVPGIVGFGRAVELSCAAMEEETPRVRQLRNLLFELLTQSIDGVTLNGPTLDRPELRLAGNLNCCLGDVDGEALMMSTREVAVSSGSACTSAQPQPSHVLRAIGLSDDATRASLRFGVGRFNTEEEIRFAAEQIAQSVHRLRRMQ